MNNTPANIIPEIDVEAQWQKFSARHLPHRHRMLPRWVAAASICLVVGVTLAMTLPRMINDKPEVQAVTESSALTEKTVLGTTKAETSFIFHNVSLQQVLETLSAYYHVNVIYNNEEAAEMRLYTQIDKDLTLIEAVSLLNQLGGMSLRIENETTLIVE